MMPSYRSLWSYHNETIAINLDAANGSNRPTTNVVSGSTEQGGDMSAMLHEAFGMHEVREDNRELEGVQQVGEENVNEEPAEGGT
jgi:hypothetical protein